MINISEEVLEKLEFIKILEHISGYAVTDYGKESILNLRPNGNIDSILTEGKFVTEAKNILIETDYPPLEYLPDLNVELSRSKIEGSLLPEKIIKEILKLAKVSRLVFNYLNEYKPENSLFENLIQNLFRDRSFEKKIEKVFTQSGDISDNASDELRKIRKEIRDKNNNLIKVVNKILKSLSSKYLVQEEYYTQRDGRFVMPVKAEHKRHVKGFIHSESSTGQTVFIEPEETLELNNEILSLNFAERREIERILRDLTSEIGKNADILKESAKTLGNIDSIFARAKYSIEIIGDFPTLNDEKLNLIDARHPILLKKLGRNNTVPLNMEISDQRVVVITGPNAGGKTVVLKTVALLAIMVQSGIHIPANPDSKLKIFNSILMDIGDQQSLEDDLSTFSSHLTNIKYILENADEKSLVIIDEIGTGTDPTEGAALATAVLIRLSEKGSLSLVTTHHGNLKLIAHNTPGFQNASMEFDLQELKPTYRFMQGIPGSSYAFEVAKRIGYKDEFLDLANQYMESDKSKIEQFLIDLENKSMELKSKLEKSELENIRLKSLANLYEKKNKELESQKREILKQAKENADNYLRDVNKKIEKAIKNIKESNAKKEVIKKEKENIEKIKEKQKKLSKKVETVKQKSNEEINVGDFVKVENTFTEGEVIEIDKNKNKAVIVSGSIKLQVKLSKLEKIKKKNKEVKREYGTEYFNVPQSTRLDIRGYRAEDAEYEVIKFLDNAYLANITQVEIIHGKGNGILKKTVHEILNDNDYVKNYYFAKVELGGEGVTIVEL